MKRIVILGILVSLSAVSFAQSGWTVALPMGVSSLRRLDNSGDIKGLPAASIGVSGGYSLRKPGGRWQAQVQAGSIYHRLRIGSTDGTSVSKGALVLLTGSLQIQRYFGETLGWNLGIGVQPEWVVSNTGNTAFLFDIEPPISFSGIVSVGIPVNEHWTLSTQAHIGFTDIFNGFNGFPDIEPDDFILKLHRYVLVVSYRF